MINIRFIFGVLFTCAFMTLSTSYATFLASPRTMAMGGVGIALSNKEDSVYLNPARLAINKKWGVNVFGLGIGFTGNNDLQETALYIIKHQDNLTGFNTGNLNLSFDASGGLGGTQKLIKNIDNLTAKLDKVDGVIKRVVNLAQYPFALNTDLGVSAGFYHTGFMITNHTYVGALVNQQLVNQFNDVYKNLKSTSKELKTSAETMQKFLKFAGKLNSVSLNGGGSSKWDGKGSFNGVSSLPNNVCFLGGAICAQHVDNNGKDEYCVRNNPLFHACFPVVVLPNKDKEVCINGICQLIQKGGKTVDPSNQDLCYTDSDGNQKCITPESLGIPPGGGSSDNDLTSKIAAFNAQLKKLQDNIDIEPTLEVLIANRSQLGVPYAYALPLGQGTLALGLTPKVQYIMLFNQQIYLNSFSFSLTDQKQYFTGNVDVGTDYVLNDPKVGKVYIPGVISAAFVVRDLIPQSFKSNLNSTYYEDPVATVGLGYSIFGISVETDLDLTSIRAPTTVLGKDIGFQNQYIAFGAEYNLFGWAAFRLGDRFDMIMKNNMYTAGLSLFPLVHLNLTAGYGISNYYVALGLSVHPDI